MQTTEGIWELADETVMIPTAKWSYPCCGHLDQAFQATPLPIGMD
jgi:hypothetical protein